MDNNGGEEGGEEEEEEEEEGKNTAVRECVFSHAKVNLL